MQQTSTHQESQPLIIYPLCRLRSPCPEHYCSTSTIMIPQNRIVQQHITPKPSHICNNTSPQSQTNSHNNTSPHSQPNPHNKDPPIPHSHPFPSIPIQSIPIPFPSIPTHPAYHLPSIPFPSVPTPFPLHPSKPTSAITILFTNVISTPSIT